MSIFAALGSFVCFGLVVFLGVHTPQEEEECDEGNSKQTKHLFAKSPLHTHTTRLQSDSSLNETETDFHTPQHTFTPSYSLRPSKHTLELEFCVFFDWRQVGMGIISGEVEAG